MPDLEQNKETVRAFYDLAFNQKKPEEAVARYVGSTYTQHNPMAGDGPQPFIEFVNGFVARFPTSRWTSSASSRRAISW
jgi:predicted SnoaL-like aldol condensation-catalyzing enzyme